jgi:hypothetical protein
VSDLITFGLAFVGYLLLGLDVVMHVGRTPRRWVSVALAVVVAIHVGLVWGWRFDWSLAYALEKGLAGFVIFHTALTLIVAAALAPEPWSGRLLYVAFPIVTTGALGAAFKYDYVAGYRISLLIALAMTVALAIRGIRSN